jgi:hypothetical protein
LFVVGLSLTPTAANLKRMTRAKGFFIVPFTPAGGAAEVGFWQADQLSSKWLEVCSGFLRAHGSSFRASWGQRLSHIETKLTSDSGAGIGSFYADGEPVISTLYLSGAAPAIEDEVTGLFLESMRKIKAVVMAQTSAKPFDAIRAIADRPLTAAVIWQNPAVEESDAQVIRELSLHFAAAFFDQT